MRNTTYTSVIPAQEQEKNFQTFYDSSLCFYKELFNSHKSFLERMNLVLHYVQVLVPAYRTLNCFIENTRDNLVENGLELQLKWESQFEDLCKKLHDKLHDIIKCYQGDPRYRNWFNFRLSDVLALLKSWNCPGAEEDCDFNYFKELEGVYIETHHYEVRLKGNCPYLQRRDTKQLEALWHRRQEELMAQPLIQQQFQDFLEAYPEDRRTEQVFRAMRETVIVQAPEELRVFLRYHYKHPEVLIPILCNKKVGEETVKYLICLVGALNKLDEIQRSAGSVVSTRVLTSLNATECLDAFCRHVFGELQALKDADGNPLIREKGDWAYVGRIFKEQQDLKLFVNYKDFLQTLQKYNVGNLPKDRSLFSRTLASISERAVYPHWKCDAHALLIGQKTLELIEKYRYLLA